MDREKTCKICGDKSNYISTAIGACLSCIRDNPEDSKPFLNNAHQKARSIHNLPGTPPKSSGGISCNICSNQCVINQGERGYCGFRWNDHGDLKFDNKPILEVSTQNFNEMSNKIIIYNSDRFIWKTKGLSVNIRKLKEIYKVILRSFHEFKIKSKYIKIINLID